MFKNSRKELAFLVLLTALIFPTVTVKADLVGRYSWGYFYSTLTSKTVEAEVVSVTKKYVRPVAQNSKTTKYGRFVHLGDSSNTEVARTQHGNRTYYNFK